MMLNLPRRQSPTHKDLKVKLPARLHLQLHALKILQGKPLQVTVSEALEAYFATQPQR